MTIQVQLDAGRSILQTAAQFSDPSRAIWEYVVNSLENRESPSNCIINISIKNTNKTICISDNSNGMDLEELTNFWVVSKDNRKFNKKAKSIIPMAGTIREQHKTDKSILHEEKK